MSSLMQNDVESLEQKDRMFFGLSDTLDVKASIGLVLIVFLASQTTNLLKNEMDPVLTFLQMIMRCHPFHGRNVRIGNDLASHSQGRKH